MKIFAIIGLLALVVLACGAPMEELVEHDPELTAGFYEGDIVLDVEKNGMRSPAKLWPGGIVYYKFNKGPLLATKHIYQITQGMDIIEDVSCIRFREAGPDIKAYVNITANVGSCYSSVGYTGRVQEYNLEYYQLNQGCYRMGIIVRELLHTLGFYQEIQTSENMLYPEDMSDGDIAKLNQMYCNN